MQPVNQKLQQHLKQHHQSITKTRQAVFAALHGKEPMTMQQLVASCPDIDRASVYRTVGLFEQLGIIQRLQIGWKYKLELTDVFSHHHHHLTCLQCGRVISFDEDRELINKLQKVADSKKFKMQGHQLEIQGLCQSCIKT